MEFRLSSEQELFKRTLRDWAEKELAPRAAEIDAKEEGIPDDIIRGLAELGVMGIGVPEEYGGSMIAGQQHTLANLAIQELARADLSMSVPVYVLLCLGWGSLVSLHGSPELKALILPTLATGEEFFGICTTEAGGGSDVANIKTTGRVQDGKLIPHGEKGYLSGV